MYITVLVRLMEARNLQWEGQTYLSVPTGAKQPREQESQDVSNSNFAMYVHTYQKQTLQKGRQFSSTCFLSEVSNVFLQVRKRRALLQGTFPSILLAIVLRIAAHPVENYSTIAIDFASCTSSSQTTYLKTKPRGVRLTIQKRRKVDLQQPRHALVQR